NEAAQGAEGASDFGTLIGAPDGAVIMASAPRESARLRPGGGIVAVAPVRVEMPQEPTKTSPAQQDETQEITIAAGAPSAAAPAEKAPAPALTPAPAEASAPAEAVKAKPKIAPVNLEEPAADLALTEAPPAVVEEMAPIERGDKPEAANAPVVSLVARPGQAVGVQPSASRPAAELAGAALREPGEMAPPRAAPAAETPHEAAPKIAPQTPPTPPQPIRMQPADVIAPVVADVSTAFDPLAPGATIRESAAAPGQIASAMPPPVAEARQMAQIAAQISFAAGRGVDERVEIRLDPPELGRVRLSFTMTDDGVAALVSADRPEIVDLMRRHAEVLHRDLTAAGYRNVTLDFGPSDHPGDERPQAESGEWGQSTRAEDGAAPAAHWRAYVLRDRLDIRL
ncbi:MAG: flagellar hook-length control protein FliK, partial [Paracoccaceae bacterium]